MSELADVELDEKVKIDVIEPGKYNVVFLNDDKTPIDFVIKLLTDIYKHNRESAEAITLNIHHEGSGVAGVYPFEIAEQKGAETVTISREHGFPLGVKVEKE